MDVILKFIGIVLLVANTKGTPPTYDVYVPDGRKEPRVCGEKVPSHLPAIRIKAAGVTWDKWSWIKCNDGRDCNLFLLEHDSIEIDRITSAGTLATGAIDYLPHLGGDMLVKGLIAPDERVKKSAAWLTLQNGTLSDDYFSNDMRYAVFTTTFGAKNDITIKSGQKWITIPAQSRIEIEFVNLPQELDLATLGNSHVPDYRHFLLYYLYADQNNQTCTTPTHHSLTSQAARLRRDAAARKSMSSTHMAITDDGDIQTGAAANADCSASTWP